MNDNKILQLHVPSLRQGNMDEKNVDDSAEKMPPPPSRQEQATIEKAEEQKLRANLAKYPQVNKTIFNSKHFDKKILVT